MVAWSTLLGWAKLLTPRIMLTMFIVSAMLLFSPASFITRIGLASFRDTNLQWVGLAFVSSIGLLGAYGIFEHLPKGIKTVRFRIKRRHRAISLTTIEKRVIQSYIRNGTRTQRFNFGSGVISGLMACGFVKDEPRAGDPISGFPYNITDWAYRYFEMHPDLIDTPGLLPWNPMEGVP
jgi:hypothetical protein